MKTLYKYNKILLVKMSYLKQDYFINFYVVFFLLYNFLINIKRIEISSTIFKNV